MAGPGESRASTSSSRHRRGPSSQPSQLGRLWWLRCVGRGTWLWRQLSPRSRRCLRLLLYDITYVMVGADERSVAQRSAQLPFSEEIGAMTFGPCLLTGHVRDCAGHYSLPEGTR